MERLPVIGSTAKSTAFVSERLDGPGGLHLFLDGNGKITASSGTLHEPKPNAFSLLDEPSALYKAPEQHGMLHCPGSTPTCRKACYVQNLKGAQPELHAMYAHNSETIRKILADAQLEDEWGAALATWITDNVKEFRWHVSGDVFSIAYAEFIRDVCRESPSVRHWIYTRSFDFLEPLVEVCTLRGGNLALNLSADKDNWKRAFDVSLDFSDDNEKGEPLRICYLATDLGEYVPYLAPNDVIFPDYTLRPRAVSSFAESEWWQKLEQRDRGLVCPVDAVGKAENRRCGPCDRCMK